MKILIVEDSEPFQSLLGKALLVKPLLDKLPNSAITIVGSMEGALRELSHIRKPDIILLDLTLPDSAIEQTIARIPYFEETAPVLIITGTSADTVKKYLNGLDVPILEKDPDVWRDNRILYAVGNLIVKKSHREDLRAIWDGIRKMETIARDDFKRCT